MISEVFSANGTDRVHGQPVQDTVLVKDMLAEQLSDINFLLWLWQLRFGMVVMWILWVVIGLWVVLGVGWWEGVETDDTVIIRGYDIVWELVLLDCEPFIFLEKPVKSMFAKPMFDFKGPCSLDMKFFIGPISFVRIYPI